MAFTPQQLGMGGLGGNYIQFQKQQEAQKAEAEARAQRAAQFQNFVHGTPAQAAPSAAGPGQGGTFGGPQGTPAQEGWMDRVQAQYNAPYMALAQQQAGGQNLISQQMLAQGIGQANNAQRSAAAAARPGMGGLAQRTAAQAAGQMQADATRQGSMAAIAEQRQAAEFLANQNSRLLQLEMSGAISAEQAAMAREQLALAQQEQERKSGWFSQGLGLLSAAAPFVGMAVGGPAGAAAGGAFTQGLNQANNMGVTSALNTAGGGYPTPGSGAFIDPGYRF